ncbi:hypothetical protein ECMP0210172_1430 [Escherichia coli MP021017.2]|nr:hypothetical protein ECMP0210172_1430 [Escherichia coli MP021017.2]EMV12793.1 hypothetical protein ECMP02101711_1422 [Escherichia coli MP021017.11]
MKRNSRMRGALSCLRVTRRAINYKKMYDPDHECYQPPLCLAH